jgi:hypothetical protein
VIDGVVSNYVTSTIVFRLSTEEPLAGIQFRAEYDPDQGSFVGLADQVSCVTNFTDDVIVVFNNCVAPGCHRGGSPAGTDSLIMVAASIPELPFPVEVTCIFQSEPGKVVTADDIHIVVEEVTTPAGVVGDPAVLGISVDVRTRF